ncbi:hypothetical protein [Streptomyces tubercidicus]
MNRGMQYGDRLGLPGLRDLVESGHSSYLRFPADVPSAGQRVVLCLRVRRFACAISSCGRRTFVEQVLGLTREARGFKVWSRTDFQRGDYVQRRGGRWFAVLRVNSKSVTVPHIQNGIGQKVVHAEGSRLDWTYTVPYDEVTGRMSAEEMTQHLQDSRRVTPCPPPAVCAGGGPDQITRTGITMTTDTRARSRTPPRPEVTTDMTAIAKTRADGCDDQVSHHVRRRAAGAVGEPVTTADGWRGAGGMSAGVGIPRATWTLSPWV